MSDCIVHDFDACTRRCRHCGILKKEAEVFRFGAGDLGHQKQADTRPPEPKADAEVYQCPFTVVIDSREQNPWSFTTHVADKSQGGGQMIVPTEVKGLKTGDYSIKGFEYEIAVERKNVDDFVSCCSGDRERFMRQIQRLASMKHAMIVVEATLPEIAEGKYVSRMSPKSIIRSIISWQMKHKTIQWQFPGTRWMSENVAFRYLEMFFKHGI